jgi:hypothetical protein
MMRLRSWLISAWKAKVSVSAIARELQKEGRERERRCREDCFAAIVVVRGRSVSRERKICLSSNESSESAVRSSSGGAEGYIERQGEREEQGKKGRETSGVF